MRLGREHKATIRKSWEKTNFEVQIGLFTVDSLNPIGARTGGGWQAVFRVRIYCSIKNSY